MEALTRATNPQVATDHNDNRSNSTASAPVIFVHRVVFSLAVSLACGLGSVASAEAFMPDEAATLESQRLQRVLILDDVQRADLHALLAQRATVGDTPRAQARLRAHLAMILSEEQWQKLDGPLGAFMQVTMPASVTAPLHASAALRPQAILAGLSP